MSYSADPAALFIQLYDQLPEELFRHPDPVVRWERDAWVKRHAMRVYEQILTHGVADSGQVMAVLDDSGDRGIFAVLRGIDWALAIINPWSPSYEYGNLTELAVRYAVTGQLNDPTTEGALLPRAAYPSRPRGTSRKAVHFGVHRVTPGSWAKIRHKTLPYRSQPARFMPGQGVRVGCAPLLETLDDVRLEFVERDGYSGFRLAPVDSPSLRERISNVIRKMDDAVAGIGVIPEATLTDDLLRYWKKEAVRTAAYDNKLRWLLVGTGPLGEDDPPPNRAVLLDRLTGEEILSQDKLAAFILTADQASAWNLPGKPASGPAAEDITPGSTVTVLETSLGRLAILICEDLNQYVQWLRDLDECGISHLFMPTFSRPITHYRWEQTDAEREIDDTGTWLVIANSLALQSAMGGRTQNGEEWYTCLIAGPGDPGRRNYKYNSQFGSAKAGDDLGLVKLNGTARLPATDAAIFHDSWPGNPQVSRDGASPRPTSASGGPHRGSPATSDLGGGDPKTRNPADGGGSDGELPPPESISPELPPLRYLTGDLPERAPVGRRISLLVRITLSEPDSASAPLKRLSVPVEGRDVTITVSAPALVPIGDLEQDLHVPAAADSEPIRFSFMTARAGLHSVLVRAFAGGTFLGELPLQVSVETGAALEEGPGRTAELAGIVAQPGEVTLQVNREGDQYSFQLIGTSWYPRVLIQRLAGDPTKVVERILSELRSMARGESGFTSPAAIRRRMANLGTSLWSDVVPDAVRRQFWEQTDSITSFVVMSNLDMVPWELLHAVDKDRPQLGFLAEHMPVVRRVYERRPTYKLALSSAAYVIPPDSPSDALDEINDVRAVLGSRTDDKGVISRLDALQELFDDPPGLLHFACHNTFSAETGSVVSMDGGPVRPDDLEQSKRLSTMAARGPLVFFNACRTAGEIYGFTQMSGWASQFMAAGAGAFVGTLWPVRSPAARKFATSFYEAIVRQNKTLGEAALHARKSIIEDLEDPTWLAYTVYGSPSTRV